MARIRTIKPEFWEDEKIGTLSHGARLLFLCCLNLSDDEGLLRWNAFYLASNAFTYDEIKIETIEKWMKELVDNELIYVYQAGMVKQKIGYIINFHKHQRIDKPQPSKFPPPNYRDSRVKDIIYKRDKGICKLCGNPLSEPPKDAPYLEESSRKRMMSCDHIKPRSKGGSDYFSNLQASHLYCNQCKAAKYGEEQIDNENNTCYLNNSYNNSEINSKNYYDNNSKNHSRNNSTEEKEKEEKKESTKVDKKEIPKEDDYQFVDADFKDVFTGWLEYKRDRKERYKSEKSIKACYNRLLKLCDGNPDTARLIVEQSIANNYAGLFELKGKRENGNDRRDYTSKQEANEYAMRQYIAERERIMQGVDDEGEKPF